MKMKLTKIYNEEVKINIKIPTAVEEGTKDNKRDITELDIGGNLG